MKSFLRTFLAGTMVLFGAIGVASIIEKVVSIRTQQVLLLKTFKIITPDGTTHSFEATAIRGVGSCAEIIKLGVVDKVVCPDFIIFTTKAEPSPEPPPEGPLVQG